jgi:uncharacterized protein
MRAAARWRALLLAVISGACAGAPPPAVGPAIDCTKATGDVERWICADSALAALDRELSDVYALAAESDNADLAQLEAEQREWTASRSACASSADAHACIERRYRDRIAAVQARHRLVPQRGPFAFECPGEPAPALVTVTYFATHPPTLIASRAGEERLLHSVPSASGSRYEGSGAMFWDHHGEALVAWGGDEPKTTCKAAARP